MVGRQLCTHCSVNSICLSQCLGKFPLFFKLCPSLLNDFQLRISDCFFLPFIRTYPTLIPVPLLTHQAPRLRILASWRRMNHIRFEQRKKKKLITLSFLNYWSANGLIWHWEVSALSQTNDMNWRYALRFWIDHGHFYHLKVAEMSRCLLEFLKGQGNNHADSEYSRYS